MDIVIIVVCHVSLAIPTENVDMSLRIATPLKEWYNKMMRFRTAALKPYRTVTRSEQQPCCSNNSPDIRPFKSEC